MKWETVNDCYSRLNEVGPGYSGTGADHSEGRE
jgi:hypothetical protein